MRLPPCHSVWHACVCSYSHPLIIFKPAGNWPARVGRNHEVLMIFLQVSYNHTSLLYNTSWEKCCRGEHNSRRHLRIHWRQSFPKKKLYSSLDIGFETEFCGKPRALWAGTWSDAFGGHFSFLPLPLVWQQLTGSSRLVWSAHIVLAFPSNIKVHSLVFAARTFCTFTC